MMIIIWLISFFIVVYLCGRVIFCCCDISCKTKIMSGISLLLKAENDAADILKQARERKKKEFDSPSSCAI